MGLWTSLKSVRWFGVVVSAAIVVTLLLVLVYAEVAREWRTNRHTGAPVDWKITDAEKAAAARAAEEAAGQSPRP